jgi:integrase
MGRRGNSEGTITKRKDGRWEARISLPDGRRKSFYGKTRQEVAQRLSQARYEVDRGLSLPDERQTVGQYLTTWLEVVRTQVRGSTWRRYSDYVRLHLVPTLGKTVLSKLTAQQVQALLAAKLKEGLSPTTVRQMHRVLHGALKDAFRLTLVQRNVTEMVAPPRPARYEMNTLSEEQVRRFCQAAAGDRFYALYVLALTTGMRAGELLALRWQDVDWEHGKLQVRTGVQEARIQEEGTTKVRSVYILAEPKTSSSRRRIALSQIAIEALRTHQQQQDEERSVLGPVWDTTYDLVFPNTIGRVMNSYSMRCGFKRLLVEAGLPAMRFHDLRHTAATLALKRGVHPKVVSEMLGHASVKMTLDIYSHVTPDMQQVIADVMDAVLQTGEAEVVVKTVVKQVKRRGRPRKIQD